ncbi:MAG: T9SS type A sorting domain-containing protein [Bacteroidota bacterium]
MKNIFRYLIFIIALFTMEPFILQAQWVQTNFPISDSVTCLTVSGNNLFVGSNNGIYLSTDKGLSWKSLNKGLTGTMIIGLTVTPKGEFFSAVYGSGIYGFNILDSSWILLPSRSYFISFSATNDYLFLGTGGVDWDMGLLFMSTDYGQSWNRAYELFSGVCDYNALSVFSRNGSMSILAGVNNRIFLSADTGASWSQVLTIGNGDIKTFGQFDSNIFAGSISHGIFHSTNAGLTWTAANEGVRDSVITSFNITSDKVFAGTANSGVVLSVTNGTQWMPFNAGFSNLNITSLAADENSIYAGTGRNGVWRRLLSEAVIYTVAANSDSGGTIRPTGNIWMTSGSDQSFTFVPNPGYQIDRVLVDGVAVDSSAGYTFTNVTTNHTISVTFGNYQVANRWNLVSLPRKAADYSATSLFPTGVSSVYSYDGSYTQQSMLSNGHGYWLKFDRLQTITLLGDTITTDTLDVVEGWNLIGSITLPVPVVNIGIVTEGLTASNFFGYANGYTKADTIMPGKGYWMKANTAGRIILSAAPLASSTRKLQIVPSGELPPPPPGIADNNKPGIPKAYALSQNYPNPFNPTTVINYQLPSEAFVRLSIYNVLGQEVRTLVNKPEQAGYKSVQFDAGNFPSGIYIYRLTAGTFADVKKMLLVR